MKSDAPGRASDLTEIRDLIHKDKRTLLLLTGSDDIEEDINDSGNLIQCIVMKDAARRAKQQDYVRGELKELPDSNKLEIVSISSRYAQEHANDQAALSGQRHRPLLRNIARHLPIRRCQDQAARPHEKSAPFSGGLRERFGALPKTDD